MLTLKNGGKLIQTPADLPDLMHAKELFLDFESASGDPTVGGLLPYKDSKIAGIAITVDDCPTGYYAPIRHCHKDGSAQICNLPVEPVERWLKSIVETCEEWINPNVKFDAHFAACAGAQFQGRLICLTTAAKVLNSDMTYQGGYGAKNLCDKWLKDKTLSGLRDEVKAYLDTVKLPRNKKAKDYALVPADIMGRYAVGDVLDGRRLYRYIQENMPADSMPVWETEIKLTPVLFDMEVEGMRVDQEELADKEAEILYELIAIEEQLHKALGFPVNPSSPTDCYNLFCVYWGLPVLAYNEAGNPSFDKHALTQYTLHPVIMTDPVKSAIVKVVQYYRKRHTLLTFFVRPYQMHNVNGLLHPDYNQAVRTGRLSCKRPNAQQLNKAAKALVKPGEGRAFLSCDYSQVEFRLIVHYTRAIDAIKAYEEDPETDFHNWVAEMCAIPRKPAKNVNFAIGYGAGRKKVTSMLSGNLELMDPTITKDMTPEQFESYCKRRAEDVFDKYNAALPGLRPTSKAAARNATIRGYVFNAYGRRLHLPETHAHIAFNRVVQSCAADIMKERTVAIAPRYNSEVRATGLKLTASVHDETLFSGDVEATRDPRVVDYIVKCLEDVRPTLHPLRVPIRSSAGWSSENWAVASGDAGALDRHNNWAPAPTGE